MAIDYDVFTNAFLNKVTEYDFISVPEFERTKIIDGYMKAAIAAFRKLIKYNLSTTGDDIVRMFDVDIPAEDIDEIADIVSEGMLVQWMHPYVYKQENLENILNTRDFTSYSPAELLLRISDTYRTCKKDFTQMMREYSYNHGDLTVLHI